jgi:hypothetical protein
LPTRRSDQNEVHRRIAIGPGLRCSEPRHGERHRLQPRLVIQGRSAAVHRLSEHEPSRGRFISRIDGANVASAGAIGGCINGVHATDARCNIKRADTVELQR